MCDTNAKVLDSVPVIDIAPLLSSSQDNDARVICVQEIGDACREWGFFYIKNHSISEETVKIFKKDVSEFFHLDQNILDKIRRTKDNSRGYFDDELTKNKLDWKRAFDFGAQDGSLDNEGMDGKNQWPLVSEHETYEETMRDYYGQMEDLSQILLGAICESLGLESNRLTENFDKNHTSYLRLNYYPICDDTKSNMAIHRHTDAGALTILYQDNHVTSLQVCRDEKWYFIPPCEGTFVINIGDMMQVWSNDKYKAPLHRVQANSTHERYSAPFFYNPAYKADVQPLVNENSEEEKPLYSVVNWGDFRAKRFAGDFADVGEEVQISNYRINV